MIQVSSLGKCYGELRAVQDVSFTVARGEIVGYLGPNGAGKSTTVKMLAGILSPTTGEILFDGQPLRTNDVKIKQRIGYVPEAGGLYESLTGFEFLQLIGRLHHLEEEVISHKAEELLRLFGLESFLHQRLSSYSKGMKQKVLLSSALIHNPDVLFLDEPLSGLDANSMLVLKELIRELAERGKTIFYCSHVLDVVERVCKRVIIIDHGKVVADADVSALKEMTRQGSLEAVFKNLTDATDVAGVARTLSEIITGDAAAGGPQTSSPSSVPPPPHPPSLSSL